jgi:hypothetical protein
MRSFFAEIAGREEMIELSFYPSVITKNDPSEREPPTQGAITCRLADKIDWNS